MENWSWCYHMMTTYDLLTDTKRGYMVWQNHITSAKDAAHIIDYVVSHRERSNENIQQCLYVALLMLVKLTM